MTGALRLGTLVDDPGELDAGTCPNLKMNIDSVNKI